MSLLDLLPPSPPTTTSRKTTSDGPLLLLAPPIFMSTPEDSPASMPGSSNQGSRRKVEFSTLPVFTSSPEQAASIRLLPPSREHRPGARSILKPSSQIEVPLESMDGQKEDKLSINEDMDSIVQQLSKNDKPTSLDAYNTLASLFRAYDELPEAIVLKNKLSTLIRYIRRDLASQDQSSEEPTDTNLILSALKLLVILVWNSASSPLLSEDARTFILDRSIHVISEHRASKNVILHYLHLLSTQNFRSPMLAANNRAVRLLDTLKELPDHVSSTAILSETIMVLGRLVDQARPVMKVKADCWVETFFKSMITPSREIRQKAISFGMKACSAFATAPSVSEAFRDMLKHETATNTTLEKTACRRLKTMLDTPEDAVQVPQIWATILLLAVNVNENVSEWSSLRICWLDVLQKCFNHSDMSVRIHANFAWNRLVCLASPHQAPDDLASLLGKPLAGQMERSGRDRQGRESRASAFSSYCNLLYYAFRPAATHKQYTRSWNEYIVKILRSSFLAKNASNSDFACRIFMAFMWNSMRVTKVWKNTRAHDNAIVEPEELPTIDAKWLRKNCGTVLQMFKLLFTYSSWSSSTASGPNYIVGAWKHFAKSLGDAASKEVKASSDTIQACAQVVRLVQELWKEGPRAVNAAEGDIETIENRLTFLLRVVIAELGAAPFIDVIANKTVCLPVVLLQTFASTAVEMKSVPHGADAQLGEACLSPKLGTPTLLLLEKTLYLLDKRLHDAYKAPDFDQRDLKGTLDIISACLRDAPGNVGVLTLRTMQPSLRVWLEDPKRSSTSDQVENVARTDAADRFAEIIVPSLGRLPNFTIESLDDLFVAGFSSTHKDTINQMVDMWNTTHGLATKMAYGRSLRFALTRLGTYVDLELVNLPLSGDLDLPEPRASTVPPAFLGFVESQSQLAAIEANEVDADLETSRHNGSPVSEEASKAAPTSRPQSSHSTPRRSRRYIDFQVQSQQIDSSPLNIVQAESQYLTERQKDVRNKQRQDAGMYFPDVRPDVAPKLPHTTMSSSELGQRELMQEERPNTPTLPNKGLADFDNDPIASPTPRSKYQALRLEDIEAPSSPISMHENGESTAQESMGPEGFSGKGFEDDHEILAGQEGGSGEESPELRQDYPIHREKLSRDDGWSHRNYLVNLAKAEVQTPDSVLEALPKLATPGPDYDAEVDLTVLKETGSASSGMNGQPTDSPARIDSDELDMMSQSQLSQDLESHMYEHGDISEPALTLLGEQPHHIPTTTSIPATSQKKRKRGRSLYAGSKRRKSRSLSRSVSIASQEERDVVYHCIEVDVSSRPPLVEIRALQRQSQVQISPQRLASKGKLANETAHAHTGTGTYDLETDAYRMPPPALIASGLAATQSGLYEGQQQSLEADTKSSFNRLTPADEPARSNAEVEGTTKEVVVTTMERQHGTSAPLALALAASKDVRRHTTLNASCDVGLNTEEVAVRTEELAVQTQLPPQQHVATQTETDIVAELQHVLGRLKQSSGECLTLRTIDELCFQIRTEGQNAATRWASR